MNCFYSNNDVFIIYLLLRMMPVTDLKTRATRKMEKLSEIEVVEKASKFFDYRSLLLLIMLLKEKHILVSLQENNLKFARAVKKAYEEKELTKQKEAEIECLERESIVLQRKKKQLLLKVQRNTIYKNFLDQVTKKSKKFGDVWELIGRFDTLLANREQLLLKENEGQELAETQRRQHRYFIEEWSNHILQCNNQLSSLQTHLDQVRSLAFKWVCLTLLLPGAILIPTLHVMHIQSLVICIKIKLFLTFNSVWILSYG
uniref:DUF4200 domain-containing protein n=1 Tax=Paramormyrops kingsleyae TaxID=1676925 RepID=A0A3B3RR29_9TELE